ncbi:MAG: hypothetical protein KDE27_22010 [Planctomycetes bacterium]|nr:hypothetical protein [Planctomycetota bacterium]
MTTSPDPTSVPPAVPTAPKKRRWPRLLLIVVGAIALVVALAPYAIGLGFVRAQVESAAGENLEGAVHIGGLSWSWTSGVHVAELRIDNPPGFPSDRPAVQIASLVADLPLRALFGGTLAATAIVEGLEVNVEQRTDGSTNLERLAKTTPGGGESPEHEEPGGEPRPFAFDVELRDGAIHVRREGELVEALTALQLQARSAPDSDDVLLTATGKLRAGAIALEARADPNTQTVDGKLRTTGLDLASWRPLIDSMLPDQLTALAGKVDGEVTFAARGGEQVTMGGELTVDAPRLAGPLLQGMDVRSERWTIVPVLALGDGSGSVDASQFAVDLEWLTIRGKPGAAAGNLALAYELDVARIAEFGGPIPESLKGSGSKLTGELRLPTADLPADAAGWAQAIGADAALRIPRLELAGFALRDVGVDATVDAGALALRSTPSTRLDGGALALEVAVGLTDLDRLPTTASLQWNGGKLTGGSTQALRYAMPLFAGLDADVAQIVGKVDLALQLAGPATKAEDRTWLAWLNEWSGSGTLGLQDAAFAPSQQLAGLLAPLGPLSGGAVPIADGGRLKIDSFRAPFRFEQGAIRSQATEWLAAGSKIGLAGSVALDGGLDYAIDLSALLQGHKDGEKVLQALGGKLPAAQLGGTLDAPSLGLPKLDDIASKLLRQEGKNLLEKGLEKGLGEIFGGKKKGGG